MLWSGDGVSDNENHWKCTETLYGASFYISMKDCAKLGSQLGSHKLSNIYVSLSELVWEWIVVLLQSNGQKTHCARQDHCLYHHSARCHIPTSHPSFLSVSLFSFPFSLAIRRQLRDKIFSASVPLFEISSFWLRLKFCPPLRLFFLSGPRENRKTKWMDGGK